MWLTDPPHNPSTNSRLNPSHGLTSSTPNLASAAAATSRVAAIPPYHFNITAAAQATANRQQDSIYNQKYNDQKNTINHSDSSSPFRAVQPKSKHDNNNLISGKSKEFILVSDTMAHKVGLHPSHSDHALMKNGYSNYSENVSPKSPVSPPRMTDSDEIKIINSPLYMKDHRGPKINNSNDSKSDSLEDRDSSYKEQKLDSSDPSSRDEFSLKSSPTGSSSPESTSALPNTFNPYYQAQLQQQLSQNKFLSNTDPHQLELEASFKRNLLLHGHPPPPIPHPSHFQPPRGFFPHGHQPPWPHLFPPPHLLAVAATQSLPQPPFMRNGSCLSASPQSSGGKPMHSEEDGHDPKPMGQVNRRTDIYNMTDQELVLIETKDLNRLMKKYKVPKEKQVEIKQRRRTLKNRGYAASCRVKRESEEGHLENTLKTQDDIIERKRFEMIEMRRHLDNDIRMADHYVNHVWPNFVRKIKNKKYEDIFAESLETGFQEFETLEKEMKEHPFSDPHGIELIKKLREECGLLLAHSQRPSQIPKAKDLSIVRTSSDEKEKCRETVGTGSTVYRDTGGRTSHEIGGPGTTVYHMNPNHNHISVQR